jgi:hypothetical protein
MTGKRLVHCCKLCYFDILNYANTWDRFLYTLYIAVDGNFKLKGKQRYLKDVELMPGWGAYVPEPEYKAHIANYVDQPEVSAIFEQKLIILTNPY